MNSRKSLILFLTGSLPAFGIVLLLVSALITGNAQAQQTFSPQQGKRITLRNQLNTGLRARTQADRAFIDKVIQLVEVGTLPRSLVDSTFLWARKYAARKSNSRRLRPIIYFQPILTQRAKQIGIKI